MLRGDIQEIRSVIGANLIEVDHLAIAVEDLEASVRFYRDLLGFDEVSRRETRGARTSMASAVMRKASTTVVLVQGNEPESQVSRFVREFGQGIQHVAFRVRDLRVVLEGLRKLGVKPEIDVIEGRGINQVFLEREGPAGVRIELIERKGGDFSDDTVERLFRQFEDRDLY
jgi:4-hydroxyphenylpyruvate dioxygenase-like putative hemolysin